MTETQEIRVGVVGLGRGKWFATGANARVGMKLVALCDTWEERLLERGRQYGVATFTDFDKLLERDDVDAVVLANYFHEHAPLAIKALAAGKHVMSETIANATLAEGVALCRAVEKSGKTYMLAENYAYTAFSMEMRRLYRSGEIGDVTYAEGEYNHPMPAGDRVAISQGLDHWRNWIPSTYYCTHALAPLVYITEQSPMKVNALSIARPGVDEQTVRRGDPGSVILCRTENGAVFRIFGLLLPGHSCWYRVHGDRGAMETTRGPGYFGPGQLRVWHEEWNCPSGVDPDRTYTPQWPEHAQLAEEAGHGGGDFWVNLAFADAIRSGGGEQPFLDVYRGVTMSGVGILAWKSALADGRPFDMPDFRDESSRRAVENDHWSPFPSHADRQSNPPPPSILGMNPPSADAIDLARKTWAQQGFRPA